MHSTECNPIEPARTRHARNSNTRASISAQQRLDKVPGQPPTPASSASHDLVTRKRAHPPARGGCVMRWLAVMPSHVLPRVPAPHWSRFARSSRWLPLGRSWNMSHMRLTRKRACPVGARSSRLSLSEAAPEDQLLEYNVPDTASQARCSTGRMAQVVEHAQPSD
jgi:hypothetical protein